MKVLIKRSLSVCMVTLLLFSLLFPAFGKAELSVCHDCLNEITMHETHGPEHESGADHEIAESPGNTLLPGQALENDISEPDEIRDTSTDETSAIERVSISVERANNPAAEAFYRENEAFSEDRRMSAGMHELYTPSGAFVLRSEKPIREAVVSADVAFYLIGETIYRMHIGTGATDKLSGLSYIKMLVVISNNVVRWNIPSRPECYDMTVSEMLDYDENDTFPFICYEYNFNTGEVREISRNQVLAEFWASESATRSTSPDIPIQASYTLYGRTLPLPGYENNKFFSTKEPGRSVGCDCHADSSITCGVGAPNCYCELYYYVFNGNTYSSYQCNGFARKVFDSILVSSGGSINTPYEDNNITSLSFENDVISSAEDWKTLFGLIPLGSKVRFLSPGGSYHYIVLLYKNEVGIVLYDANGDNHCKIRIVSKKYADMKNNWTFDKNSYFETIDRTHDHYYILDPSGGTHSCAYNACDQKNLAHALGTEVSDENADKHSRTCTACRDKVMFDHSFTQYTNITNTHHAVKCSACQRVGSAAAHQNVGYTPLQSGHRVACAVCGTTTLPHSFEVAYNAASHYALCSYCGYVNTAVSEDHSFAYADVDDTVHRRYCTGCGYGGNSSHAFSAWISSGSSSHKRTCSLCGREVTQAHVFGAWSNFSASQHRSQCSACSHYRYGNHGYGSWGQYSSSRHQRSCVSCGRYDYASHTFGSWSSLSATQHRRTCNACGYNNDASHSFSYEQIPNNRAAHRVNCSTCGYSAVQPHSPDANGYCIRCGSYTGIYPTGAGESEQ